MVREHSGVNSGGHRTFHSGRKKCCCDGVMKGRYSDIGWVGDGLEVLGASRSLKQQPLALACERNSDVWIIISSSGDRYEKQFRAVPRTGYRFLKFGLLWK